MVNPEKCVKAFRLMVTQLNCTVFGRHWGRRGEGIYYLLVLKQQSQESSICMPLCLPPSI